MMTKKPNEVSSTKAVMGPPPLPRKRSRQVESCTLENTGLKKRFLEEPVQSFEDEIMELQELDHVLESKITALEEQKEIYTDTEDTLSGENATDNLTCLAQVATRLAESLGRSASNEKALQALREERAEIRQRINKLKSAILEPDVRLTRILELIQTSLNPGWKSEQYDTFKREMNELVDLLNQWVLRRDIDDLQTRFNDWSRIADEAARLLREYKKKEEQVNMSKRERFYRLMYYVSSSSAFIFEKRINHVLQTE
jgi:hypothetical protein